MGGTLSSKKEEMAAVLGLLKPINDEENKIFRVLKDIQQDKAVNKHSDAIDVQDLLSERAIEAERELDKNDSKALQVIIGQINADNDRKHRELFAEKKRKRELINDCDNEAEKSRLLQELELYEQQMIRQIRDESSEQDQKLKEALDARRNKRALLINELNHEKHAVIQQAYQDRVTRLVEDQYNEKYAEIVAQKIKNRFDKDQIVQVTENMLDKKNKQELIDLMNALFEEHANALRLHLFELMKQKHQEIDMLREEFGMERNVLKNRREKDLLSAEEYKLELERLGKEEYEKSCELEIRFADKEQEIREDLEMVRLDAELQQKTLLKDRQTQEKLVMFHELTKGLEEKDPIRNYLLVESRNAEKELQEYERKIKRDHDRKVEDITKEKERKNKELAERLERMFSWEDMVKKDEQKLMLRIAEMKQEAMAKKLEEQQKEILKNMNQKDVDQMLERHKEQLKVLEKQLSTEHERQSAQLKEKLKQRNEANARRAVLRDIRMAEIQKQKEEDMKRANIELKDFDLLGVDQAEKVNEDLKKCMDKVAEFQTKLALKQCYSKQPMYFKRH